MEFQEIAIIIALIIAAPVSVVFFAWTYTVVASILSSHSRINRDYDLNFTRTMRSQSMLDAQSTENIGHVTREFTQK